ncbi:MAG: hypothetical protein LH473_10230 [Chitinophagales bacterium]|nr:hypothetical protein [Chitinophagales bacterium]
MVRLNSHHEILWDSRFGGDYIDVLSGIFQASNGNFLLGGSSQSFANGNKSSTGIYSAGNIFTAQLSDASGSFSSPTSIGTFTSTQSGTIGVTIPIATPTGTQYRIRVVSSNPSITGTDNGEDITINALTCDIPAAEFTDEITKTLQNFTGIM